MSRNEDYLDDLLNSVSDANRRNNKKDIESLIESMNLDPIKQREREKVQPPPRRDFGEKFVREFEQEIALGSADDFLRDFEMELDAEAADSQSDIEVDEQDERQDVKEHVSDIVDGAMRRLESDSCEEESAMQEEASVTDMFLGEEADSELQAEPPQDEVSAYLEDAESEGQMMDESVDLMDILSGDDELSDIGNMLKADEEGESLEETESSSDGGEAELFGLGDEDMDDTADGEELQDEFDRLGSIDELKAIGEKKKKKKKSGFFTTLLKTLFGDDEEEAAGPVAEESELGSISDENRGILQEMDAAEAKEKGKKSRKDKKKKDKGDKKEQAKKEKKPKPKKVKPPKEKDNTPPLPKKPVILIFVMAISILVLILLGSANIQYSQDIRNAKDCYGKGDYTGAYHSINGAEIKKKDEGLYRKIMIMANIQQEYDTYETMMDLEEYELALDALVRGIGRCNNFVDEATEFGARPELEQWKSIIAHSLEEQFGVSEEQAKELCAIHKRKDYTKALWAILVELGLQQQE